MTIRNLIVNLLYYGVTLLSIPWLLLYLEDRLGVARLDAFPLKATAVILATTAAGFQLWCIAIFQHIGRGTPSPLLPPSRLVTVGPYRWLRNPMNLGEVGLFVALGMWFGSPFLMAYAVGSWLIFHAFLIYYEEPGLARRFGGDYRSYCARVRRWWPRGR